MNPDEMTGRDLMQIGADWLKKIADSEKREDRWRTDAEYAERVFSGGGEDEKAPYDFNILYSNIETLVPAVFNTSPKPDIRESFSTGPSDPMAAVYREVAQVLERGVEAQLDNDVLTIEMQAAVQDALLSGRGVVRIRFDADEEKIPGKPLADEMGQPMIGEDGMPVMGEPSVKISRERVEYEVVAWRDYRQGPAARHEDVQWKAYRHTLPKEDIDRIRDPDLRAKLQAAGEYKDEADKKESGVWECWCKAKREVLFITVAGEVIRIAPDPLGLRYFFPSCEPIQPNGLTGKTEPINPFALYRRLAEELDRITVRINAVLSGMKVRGLIIGSSDDIAELSKADENTLIPIANMEGVAATGGLANAIQWWPVDQAAKVLAQLYVARDSTKQIIYEVTGISDVVRGATDSAETATAQQLKSQWVSLRIKKTQDAVARAARELIEKTAEIVGTKFSAETIQHMTGVQMTPEIMDILAKPLDFYRIDIETDSTIRADMSRSKGEMSEFLTATSGFFSTMAPVVAQAPQMAGPIVEIYAAFARQFNLGKQAEDALEKMIAVAGQAASQPQGPSAEQMQAETDAKNTEAELGLKDREVKVKEGALKLDAVKMAMPQPSGMM
jgi:hypothetical protein